MMEKICSHIKSKKEILITILIIVVLIIGFALFNRGDIKNSDKEKISSDSQKLEKETKSVYSTNVGLIKASQEAKLSFKNPGQISKIYFLEGVKIRKGTLLAEISSKEIEVNNKYSKELSKKSYSSIELTQKYYNRLIDNAEYELEKAEETMQDGNEKDITIEQLENSIRSYKELKKLGVLEAESNNIKTKLNKELAYISSENNYLYAPFDGYIIATYFEENENVSAGTPVFHFVSNDVKVISFIDKDEAKLISKDSEINFAGSKEILKISHIFPAINQMTGEVEIELEFNNNKIEKVFINELIEFSIKISEKEMLKIDKAFIDYEFDGMYLTKSDGNKHRIQNYLNDSKYIFIEENEHLKAGDEIVK